MIDKYLTIEKECTFKLKVKNSQFYVFAFPILNLLQANHSQKDVLTESSKLEAEEYISKLKKEFYDATHICYAYVAGINAEIFHYSDAGEPHGTAGIKILNAIRSKNLTNILVVVVRYFGGTKLGVGPLAKAYHESAKGVLNLVEIKQKFITNKYNLTLSYDEYEKVKLLLNHFITETFSTDYTENVIISVSVKLSQAKEFEEFLKNYFKGRIIYERID